GRRTLMVQGSERPGSRRGHQPRRGLMRAPHVTRHRRRGVAAASEPEIPKLYADTPYPIVHRHRTPHSKVHKDSHDLVLRPDKIVVLSLHESLQRQRGKALTRPHHPSMVGSLYGVSK